MRIRDRHRTPRVRTRPDPKPRVTIREELERLKDRAWFHNEDNNDRIWALIQALKEGVIYEDEVK